MNQTEKVARRLKTQAAIAEVSSVRLRQAGDYGNADDWIRTSRELYNIINLLTAPIDQQGEPVPGPSDVVEEFHSEGGTSLMYPWWRMEAAIAEIERLRGLLGDVLVETVDASAYCDGPNIDGDLRTQIREALEGK